MDVLLTFLVAASPGVLVGVVLIVLHIHARRHSAADLAAEILSEQEQARPAGHDHAGQVECSFQVRAYQMDAEGYVVPDVPIDGDVIDCEVDDEIGLAIFHVHRAKP